VDLLVGFPFMPLLRAVAVFVRVRHSVLYADLNVSVCERLAFDMIYYDSSETLLIDPHIFCELFGNDNFTSTLQFFAL